MSEEVRETKKKRKPDYKTRMAIKEREKEMREESIREAAKIQVAPVETKITFDQWWMKITAKVKMRYQDKEVIRVDFKSQGLSNSETEEAYDNALRVFGIKW